MSINTWNLEIDFWKKTTKLIVRAEKKTESETKNGMGPMLEGLLGSYGVGKVGFSEAKLSIQSLDTDI